MLEERIALNIGGDLSWWPGIDYDAEDVRVYNSSTTTVAIMK